MTTEAESNEEDGPEPGEEAALVRVHRLYLERTVEAAQALIDMRDDPNVPGMARVEACKALLQLDEELNAPTSLPPEE